MMRRFCWSNLCRLLLWIIPGLIQFSSPESLIDVGGDYNAESKYQAAVSVLNDIKSSSRDIRRTISTLEELSLGTGRVSADSLAELSMLYLVGTRLGTQNVVKAAQYSQRSAALGSPKGRHIYAFLLLYGGIGGVRRNESEAWRQEELAAQQNFLPALMAVGFHRWQGNDCESALRYDLISRTAYTPIYTSLTNAFIHL